tara:strand:+ start:562 stop:708 length:147 start_codon:yes stop_codon:yes gene_type:complete
LKTTKTNNQKNTKQQKQTNKRILMAVINKTSNSNIISNTTEKTVTATG